MDKLIDVIYTRKEGKLVAIEIWRKEVEIKSYTDYLHSLNEHQEVDFESRDLHKEFDQLNGENNG